MSSCNRISFTTADNARFSKLATILILHVATATIEILGEYRKFACVKLEADRTCEEMLRNSNGRRNELLLRQSSVPRDSNAFV